MQKEQIEITQNEQKDANNRKNMDEKDEEIAEEQAVYSFGVRYYYWDYYKNHKTLKKWYIKKKYETFKQELEKKIEKYQWEQTMTKAKNMMKGAELLKLKSYEWKNYKVDMDRPIRCEHVVAICLYTDYDELSYEFSKSFRKISTDKTDEDTKKRNMEYREWSRILRYSLLLL